MKTKREQEAVDRWDGILDPIPFVAESGADSSEKYNVFAMINGYESEAREILKAGGYPVTLKELLNKPQGKRQIRDIMRMLTYFREVRIYIWMNDAPGAALSMAYGIRAAMQARIRPVEPLIEIGKSRSDQQKETRNKRRTWKGLTRKQILTRNQKIIEHYKEASSKSGHIKLHGFAVKHANKYLLKPTRLKQIIKSSLDT